jgi:hypothetical protein
MTLSDFIIAAALAAAVAFSPVVFAMSEGRVCTTDTECQQLTGEPVSLQPVER